MPYPPVVEWVCGHQITPERVEYRLAVEAQAVQGQLRDLAAFCEAACQQGYAVQLWL